MPRCHMIWASIVVSFLLKILSGPRLCSGSAGLVQEPAGGLGEPNKADGSYIGTICSSGSEHLAWKNTRRAYSVD